MDIDELLSKLITRLKNAHDRLADIEEKYPEGFSHDTPHWITYKYGVYTGQIQALETVQDIIDDILHDERIIQAFTFK